MTSHEDRISRLQAAKQIAKELCSLGFQPYFKIIQEIESRLGVTHQTAINYLEHIKKDKEFRTDGYYLASRDSASEI